MASRRIAAFAATAAFAVTACSALPDRPSLARFEATLATQDSATAALRQWCAARHLADPPDIRALPATETASPPPAGLQALLAAGAAEPLGYRHVRLACGQTVLSEAHNWFVPGRLPPEMNRVLATSDTPFGKVIAPLGFTRERLASVRGPAPGCPRDTILSHRALLRLSDGQPISVVVECYTAANLAAPPPVHEKPGP